MIQNDESNKKKVFKMRKIKNSVRSVGPSKGMELIWDKALWHGESYNMREKLWTQG